MSAAITHVNEHGSHHTDAIVTENVATADAWVSPIPETPRTVRANDNGNSTSDLVGDLVEVCGIPHPVSHSEMAPKD